MKFRIVTVMRNIIAPAIALAILLTLAISSVPSIYGQEPNKAAIVVRLSEDQVASSCVSFSEESLSGMELLRRSGLAIETKVEGMGSLVCSIENTGCPAGDCFCQCSGGGECVYWSYWRGLENGWDYARVGATQNQVSPGGLDGWSWGPGSVTEAIAPPLMTFEEICSQGNIDPPASVPETSVLPAWQPYAVFAAILLLLGGVLLFTRKRRPG